MRGGKRQANLLSLPLALSIRASCVCASVLPCFLRLPTPAAVRMVCEMSIFLPLSSSHSLPAPVTISSSSLAHSQPFKLSKRQKTKITRYAFHAPCALLLLLLPLVRRKGGGSGRSRGEATCACRRGSLAPSCAACLPRRPADPRLSLSSSVSSEQSPHQRLPAKRLALSFCQTRRHVTCAGLREKTGISVRLLSPSLLRQREREREERQSSAAAATTSSANNALHSSHQQQQQRRQKQKDQK